VKPTVVLTTTVVKMCGGFDLLPLLVYLFARLGADGGTIPTRDELVKLKSKDEVVNPHMLTRIKWFSCALSKLALEAPIVADVLGNLFNKEVISIQFCLQFQ
jgi:hypothetical protein